jgi:TPR repeat protein
MRALTAASFLWIAAALSPAEPASPSAPDAILAEVEALFLNENADEAVAKLRSAAGRGIPEAQAELGRIYFAGTYVEKDDAAAEYFLRQSLSKPDPSYKRDLACVIYHRANGHISPEYTDLIEDAAKSGDLLAQIYLARLYLAGLDRPANTVYGNYLLEQALAKVHRPPIPDDQKSAFLRSHLPEILGDGICGPRDSYAGLLAKSFPMRYREWPEMGERRGYNGLGLLLPN